MDWLTHTITALLSLATGIGGAYVWYCKQMVAVDKARADLSANQQQTTAAAWEKLYDRCEAKCGQQSTQINNLVTQMTALHRENAEQGAQLKIQASQIAALQDKLAEIERNSTPTIAMR